MRTNTYKVEPVTCPRCLTRMDGLTHLGPGMALPEPDDFTLCAYCDALLVYIADLSVRLPTADEELVAAMDPRIAIGRLMGADIRANRARREGRG